MKKELTAKEKEVLELLSNGATSKEVAQHFENMTSRTVDTHRNNIINKLGARNIIHAYRISLESKTPESKFTLPQIETRRLHHLTRLDALRGFRETILIYSHKVKNGITIGDDVKIKKGSGLITRFSVEGDNVITIVTMYDKRMQLSNKDIKVFPQELIVKL